MVDIQTVSIAVASTSVTLAAVYYLWQFRHQNKVRETDIIFRLYTHACSKEFIEATRKLQSAEYEDYNDFVKRYGDVFFCENPVPIALSEVGRFYEGIGVLLHRKLVSVDLIRKLFTVGIVWEKVKPIVIGVREQYHAPTYREWFEYLYDEMEKRKQTLQQRGA
jgi:hypothetical protein